jgi:hypothetical protein
MFFKKIRPVKLLKDDQLFLQEHGQIIEKGISHDEMIDETQEECERKIKPKQSGNCVTVPAHILHPYEIFEIWCHAANDQTGS